MEVLHVLLVLVALAALLGMLFMGLMFAGFFVIATFRFAPGIAGLVACVFLWRGGHDNIGVGLAIAGVVATFPWSNWLETRFAIYRSGGRMVAHWSDGKRARYDTHGKVIGYEDK